MAQKQRTVEFYREDHHTFEVWTDLPPNAIMSIDGILDVGNYLFGNGAYAVFFDPRYDIEDIKADLIALAAHHSIETGLANFTQHPRADWPGHCGMDPEHEPEVG